MKITKIERAKKNKSKVNIYVDGEYAFSVYEDVFLKMRISSGMEIDESFIEKAKSESELEHSKQYLLNILSRKNYTERELMNKLIGRRVSRPDAEALVERVKSMGLLDDEKYIRDYFSFLCDSRKYSKQEIMMKMKVKFPGDERVSEYGLLLRDYDEESVLEKLVPKVKAEERKVVARFMRKGFRYETVERILKKLRKEM